jgi:hypothetical protein
MVIYNHNADQTSPPHDKDRILLIDCTPRWGYVQANEVLIPISRDSLKQFNRLTMVARLLTSNKRVILLY